MRSDYKAMLFYLLNAYGTKDDYEFLSSLIHKLIIQILNITVMACLEILLYLMLTNKVDFHQLFREIFKQDEFFSAINYLSISIIETQLILLIFKDIQLFYYNQQSFIVLQSNFFLSHSNFLLFELILNSVILCKIVGYMMMSIEDQHIYFLNQLLTTTILT